jgi:hypothetical protein
MILPHQFSLIGVDNINSVILFNSITQQHTLRLSGFK